MGTTKLNDNLKDIKLAAQIIKNGGVVAVPTETVYGLSADMSNQEAVKKIFVAKKRPMNKALIVLISKLSDIYNLPVEFNNTAQILAQKFWPGPLTLVCKKTDSSYSFVTANENTMAIRFTSSEIVTKLMQYSGKMLVAPSANISGSKTALNYNMVLEELDGKIDAIICSDKNGIGLNSTIVDVSDDKVNILREGAISKKEIQMVKML